MSLLAVLTVLCRATAAAANGCHVVAFEPQERARQLLNASIVTNQFEELVQVDTRPVWDTYEPLELAEGQKNWGSYHL